MFLLAEDLFLLDLNQSIRNFSEKVNHFPNTQFAKNVKIQSFLANWYFHLIPSKNNQEMGKIFRDCYKIIS